MCTTTNIKNQGSLPLLKNNKIHKSCKSFKVGRPKSIKNLYLKPKEGLRGVNMHYHEFQKKEMLNHQCKAKFELEQHNVHNVKVQGVTTFALNPRTY